MSTHEFEVVVVWPNGKHETEKFHIWGAALRYKEHCISEGAKAEIVRHQIYPS